MDTYYLICTYILAGIIGLCVGSFLNVLIWRLPRGENIAKPASHCTKCGYYLKWYDNIPVLSYIILRGKCRNCGERISPRYTIVEIFNCLIWLACVWRFNEYGIGVIIAFCVALSALTVAFFTDLENTMIPDSMTIGIALSGVAVLILEIFDLGVGVSWQDRLWGLALGAGSFALFYFGSIFILKKEGLGFGDVKLMGAVGLLLGWKSTLLCIIVACIVTLVWVLINAVVNRKKERENGKEFPFAPFLTASAAFCLFFGDMIVASYINLLIGG